MLAPHAEGLAAGWNEDGVEVETFRYAPERFERFGYGRSLKADETMARAALLAAPLYLLGARRALARALREPGWNVVQAHWLVPNLLAAASFARRVPLVVGLHGSDVFTAEKPGIRAWARRALGRARALTACSPELAARVQAIGFPAERSHVVPYGVDGQLFRPDPERRAIWRSRLGIPAEAPLLLGVGRMATKKGFRVLLDAFDRVALERPEAPHLVLAGGGDLLPELERRAAAWPGRVHFPGAVLHDTLPDLYRAADLFVLPAVHDARGNVDGLPNVILEAMASGLAIVGTAISGLPLAIDPERNGWLVPERDPEALAQALITALASREGLAARGAASRARSLAEFTWESVAARYRAAYLDAIADRPREEVA